MDQSSDGLADLVKEISSSNRFILKRLNRLFLSPGDETCTCSCKEEVRNCTEEFKRLQYNIDKLEAVLKQFGDRIIVMEHRMERFDSTLMVMQTDESKLRRNLREEQSLHGKQVLQEKDYSSVVENSDNKLAAQNNGRNCDNVKTPDDSRASKKADADSIHVQLDQESHNNGNESGEGVERGSSVANSTVTSSEESETIQMMNVRNSSREMCSGGEGKTLNGVEVVEQTVVQCHDDELFWKFLAQREMEYGRETLKDLEGIHSIICLDISASMSKCNSWIEAKSFVIDYLNGLEEVSTTYGLSDEHVALVTFGHETKVQRRLTNKYNELKAAVEKLRLGGPSSLYGGMALALAAAGSSEHQVTRVNYLTVFTKIIIITDGHLTDQTMFAGPDVPPKDVDTAKAKVVQAVEEYRSFHLDMYLVPVGQADTEFLELMAAVGEGTMLDFKGGRQLARRSYLITKMDDPLGLMPFFQDDSHFSTEDKKTLRDIREHARKIKIKQIPDRYLEINDGDFPPIGSRVRRGPDWKWNEQDSHGPGTVIGHHPDTQVWVEWDADGNRNIYRYGRSEFDVLIVDEPRKLKQGQEIAVGCTVRPGKDLPEFRPTDKGVVIKLDKDERKATIRWNNGKRRDCLYGNSDKQEIVVCSEFQPFGTQGYVLGYTPTPEPAKPEEKQMKNKNKNVNVSRTE